MSPLDLDEKLVPHSISEARHCIDKEGVFHGVLRAVTRNGFVCDRHIHSRDRASLDMNVREMEAVDQNYHCQIFRRG